LSATTYGDTPEIR